MFDWSETEKSGNLILINECLSSELKFFVTLSEGWSLIEF